MSEWTKEDVERVIKELDSDTRYRYPLEFFRKAALYYIGENYE